MFSYIRLLAPSPILNREEEQKRFWLNRPVITYYRRGSGWEILGVPHGCQGCHGKQRRDESSLTKYKRGTIET